MTEMTEMTETLARVSDSERRRRWRLVLGGAAEDVQAQPVEQSRQRAAESTESTESTENAGGSDDGAAGGSDSAGSADGLDGASDGSGGGQALVGDDRRIDAALGALYDRDDVNGTGPRSRRGGGKRAGGLGRSKPGVVRWLGDIRTYFPTPLVQIMQRDAVERLDLKQLLLEPELL